jgi:hypothetical protein
MNSKRIEYINVECLTSKNGYDNSCRLKQVLPLCKKQSYLPAHADCFNSVLWEKAAAAAAPTAVKQAAEQEAAAAAAPTAPR